MKIVKTLCCLDGSPVERVQLDSYEDEEFQFDYLGSHFTLTTNHSCSHDNQPVVVDEDREAIGEGDLYQCGDRLVLGFQLYEEAVRSARGVRADLKD